MERFHIAVFRSALIAMLIVITYLSTTRVDFQIAASVNDKLQHALAFYILAVLADFSFPKKGFNLYKIIPLFGYGVLIETIQYFISYRTFSWLDMAADAAGMMLYGFSLPALKYAPLLRRRWNP